MNIFYLHNDRKVCAEYLKKNYKNNFRNFGVSDFSGAIGLLPPRNVKNSGHYSNAPKEQHPPSLTDSQRKNIIVM